MSIFTKIGDFFAGAGGNVIERIAETVDTFITNPDEKKAFILELQQIEEEQKQNQRKFITEIEELAQQRETDIELTIRAELDTQKAIIIEELKQDDRYTKRARPTVVYVGLIFILFEILGIRHIILANIDLGDLGGNIIESSTSVFKFFLASWASVVGIYAVGRSVEKRGTRNAWTAAATGSNLPKLAEHRERDIINNVKDKLKEIKW